MESDSAVSVDRKRGRPGSAHSRCSTISRQGERRHPVHRRARHQFHPRLCEARALVVLNRPLEGVASVVPIRASAPCALKRYHHTAVTYVAGPAAS